MLVSELWGVGNSAAPALESREIRRIGRTRITEMMSVAFGESEGEVDFLEVGAQLFGRW